MCDDCKKMMDYLMCDDCKKNIDTINKSNKDILSLLQEALECFESGEIGDGERCVEKAVKQLSK